MSQLADSEPDKLPEPLFFVTTGTEPDIGL